MEMNGVCASVQTIDYVGSLFIWAHRYSGVIDLQSSTVYGSFD